MILRSKIFFQSGRQTEVDYDTHIHTDTGQQCPLQQIQITVQSLLVMISGARFFFQCIYSQQGTVQSTSPLHRN